MLTMNCVGFVLFYFVLHLDSYSKISKEMQIQMQIQQHQKFQKISENSKN